jgi:predicted dehydrogenase
VKKLTVGILGFRGVQQDHARQIAASKKLRLVSICDLKRELRDKARDDFGVGEIYGDYRELIRNSDVDIIVNALPVPLHLCASMDAMKAGRHVLCEKPPAKTVAEARKMVEFAAKKKLCLSWGLQRRFLPEMHAARDAAAKGRMGKLYRIEVKYTLSRSPAFLTDPLRMTRSLGGGVFFDLGVHALDLAWSLLGHPRPLRVKAVGHTAFADWNCVKNPSDMAEDNMTALFTFEGGAMAEIETCFVSQRSLQDQTGHRPHLHILGDKGGLKTPSLEFVSGGRYKANVGALKIKKQWEIHERRQMLENFADAVAGKSKLLIQPGHGVDLMRMLTATLKSADKGNEVAIS